MASRAAAAAIVGIGATEFSKKSGRSELRLALEAISAALADAGLAPGDVDGFTTIAMDHNDEHSLARALGLDELSFFARTPFGGGGGCASVMLAAAAVAQGLAGTVVCYRAMNERSGQRFGGPLPSPTSGNESTSLQIDESWYRAFGMGSPGGYAAMAARRYMHEFGATSEDFGRVSVVARQHAATNPHAWFHGRPITLEDHQESRLIVDPLRLLDFCQESDGAVAIVVTSADRAASLRRPSVLISGAAQGMGPQHVGLASHFRERFSNAAETAVAARRIYAQAGLTADDIDGAILYDHFTPGVLMQLEALGFCAPGEARHFVADGQIELGGALPVNTNGGQLGEGYIHGFNGIAEAVRQLRGDAVNQIEGACHMVVTSANFVPTSALVLSAA